jgi:hypothetical protein
MNTNFVVPEPDVLIATTVFLIERGVTPYQFSVATGRGLKTSGAIERLRKAFAAIGRTPVFAGIGADILGISESEWWVIECKGSGAGKPQTHRNKFDRALASVVSYFEEIPQSVPSEFENTTVCLGLALPATQAYLNELKRRVRLFLRKRLNLWVLLYQLETSAIKAVSPEDAEPFNA